MVMLSTDTRSPSSARPCLHWRAVPVEDGDQIHKRTGAAVVDVDDNHSVGDPIIVKIAKGDYVVVKARVYLFCRTLAEPD